MDLFMEQSMVRIGEEIEALTLHEARQILEGLMIRDLLSDLLTTDEMKALVKILLFTQDHE